MPSTHYGHRWLAPTGQDILFRPEGSLRDVELKRGECRDFGVINVIRFHDLTMPGDYVLGVTRPFLFAPEQWEEDQKLRIPSIRVRVDPPQL